MQVEYISFSAHADFQNTSAYIEQLQPPNIVLVHGDSNEMRKLQNELNLKYKEKVKVLTPKNCQSVKLMLLSKKTAKVIGKLAQNLTMYPSSQKMEIDLPIKQASQEEEQVDTENYVSIEGVMVKHDFDHIVLAEEEIEKYTTLTKSHLFQTLYVPFKHDLQLLNYYLHSFFADVSVNFPSDPSDKFDVRFLVD